MPARPADPTDASLPVVGLIGDDERTRPFAEALAAGGVPVGPSADAEDAAGIAAQTRCVVVAVPPAARAAVARAALAAGAHVFLAWPPAAAPEEAEGLLALAEEAGAEVGVARPLHTCALLAAAPAGWQAQLVTVSLVAGHAGALTAVPWSHRLAGVLDLCATLAGSPDLSRLDAQTEPPVAGAPPGRGALALGLRFRNGAFAQVLLRASPVQEADDFALYAAGAGARVEARALAGPLCVDPPAAAEACAPAGPVVPDVVAFVRAIAARRAAPFALEAALDTMRLVESVQARLR
jgi:hypothetical protein